MGCLLRYDVMNGDKCHLRDTVSLEITQYAHGRWQHCAGSMASVLVT